MEILRQNLSAGRYFDYINGNLNISALARVCELSRPTVYKHLRLLK
ncbi:MAG: hypothetical protein IKK75_06615 [Clostridia bacterium]|nr:hypothetical protein [Clostridia bacterium]